MNQVAKEEDPTRPTAYAEFPHPEPRSGPFATEGITDIFATNRYFLWYTEPLEEFGPLLDDLNELVGDQPLAVSEYGGGAALTHHTDNPRGGRPEVRSAAVLGLEEPDDGDSPDSEREVSYQPEEYAAYLHEETYRVIASKPYLWGSFVWNMFDFGSAHRNEGDVLGVNTKGLVTFDRQTRKDPFFFYKANWSSSPVTHVVGRRYTDRAYAVTDVKVYSNADSVELSVNGTPVGSMTADQCPQRTCLFEDVRLRPGGNTVVATGQHGGTRVTDSVTWTLNAGDVNIAAGRLATGYVSSQGTRFGSDDFFVGGANDGLGEEAGGVVDKGQEEGGDPAVRGTDDPFLYKYFRCGEFRYEIPLPDGRYEVTLGFLEPDPAAGVGDRVFDVTANGQPLLEDFDIRREAGNDRVAVTETFPVEVSGGRLTLEFDPTEGEALVSNIKVTRQQ
jgi:beta-galactosidase